MKKKIFLKRLNQLTYIFIIIILLMLIMTPCFIYFNSKYKIINTNVSKAEVEMDIF